MLNSLGLWDERKNRFYHSIGVNANYNMKRERVSGEEIAVNDECLIINVIDMLNNLQEAVQKIHYNPILFLAKMFDNMRKHNNFTSSSYPGNHMVHIFMCTIPKFTN